MGGLVNKPPIVTEGAAAATADMGKVVTEDKKEEGATGAAVWFVGAVSPANKLLLAATLDCDVLRPPNRSPMPEEATAAAALGIAVLAAKAADANASAAARCDNDALSTSSRAAASSAFFLAARRARVGFMGAAAASEEPGAAPAPPTPPPVVTPSMYPAGREEKDISRAVHARSTLSRVGGPYHFRCSYFARINTLRSSMLDVGRSFLERSINPVS